MSTWLPNVQWACLAPLHQLELRFIYTLNSRSTTHLCRRKWFDCLTTVSLSGFLGKRSLWKTHTVRWITRVQSFQILGSRAAVAADFAWEINLQMGLGASLLPLAVSCYIKIVLGHSEIPSTNFVEKTELCLQVGSSAYIASSIFLLRRPLLPWTRSKHLGPTPVTFIG